MVIDTVVCSCTALVILSTGVLETGLEGTALTTAAFSAFWGNDVTASLFIGVIIALFAFTTAVVCAYYGELCVYYLIQNKKLARYLAYLFRLIMCLFAIVGFITPLEILWTNDFALAFCMYSCLLALLKCRKHIHALTKEYVESMGR